MISHGLGWVVMRSDTVGLNDYMKLLTIDMVLALLCLVEKVEGMETMDVEAFSIYLLNQCDWVGSLRIVPN